MAGARGPIPLEELYARYGSRIYNYLYWLSGEPGAASTLAQQTFLRYALQRLQRRAESDLQRAGVRLYRLATGLAEARESRRRWRERLTLGRSARGPMQGGEAGRASPEVEAFRAALRRSSGPSRAALLLREMEQLSFEQLQEVLDASPSSLRRRLFSAREELGRAIGSPPGQTRQCRQAWMLLSASRDGNLTLQEQEKLKAHLEQCPWCADRAHAYEMLARHFQALPRQALPDELRESIFGTPTALAMPWVAAPVELLLAAIIGIALLAGVVAMGAAAWQSGFLAAVFERPFTGPSIYVANAAEKGSISVVAAKGERVVAQVPLGAQPRSLAISPDNRWLYAAHDLGVSVLSTRDNSISAVVQVPGGAQRVLVHPITHQIYALSAARGPVPGRIWAYDGNSHARVDQTLAGFDPYEAAISPDGRRIYIVGGRDTSLTVLDTANLNNVRSLRLPSAGYDYSLVPAPDSSLVYVIDRRRGRASLIDGAGSTVLRTVALWQPREAPAIPAGARPSLLAAGGAAVSPDGKRLYVASVPPGDGLGIFTTDSFAEVGRVARRIDGVAAGPEALYLTSAAEGAVLVVDPATYRVVAALQVGESPHSLVYKP
ncbi:MAG: zf-HC2 domain-containing protein [Bacteroidetes bacterium]|nr:zf-HC2 domain-containing protein [Bacteroidota bacterium]